MLKFIKKNQNKYFVKRDIMKNQIDNLNHLQSNLPVMFKMKTFLKMETIMKKMIKLVVFFIFFLPLNLSIALSETKEVNEVIKDTSESKAPLYSDAGTSEDLAAEFLNGVGLTEGDNNGLFVAVGTAYLPESDPANNPDFIMMRRMKASEASLEGKRQFIEFIRTTMSAEDVVVLPESPFTTEFDQQMTDTRKKVTNALRKYKRSLAKVDKMEAKKLNTISYEILAKEGIMAAIKKYNPDLDTAKVEKKINKAEKAYKEELKKARSELENSQKDLDSIKAELEKLRGSLQQENISSVETFSKMNVVGLVPIASFESWDGEQYSTTIISIWTNKEEQRARALYSGQKVTYEPGDISIKDFVNKTDWSTAQGVRKFFDNEGNFWLIAIGSSPIKGKSSRNMREAKGFAQTNAQAQIGFVLLSEASSKRKAKDKLQEVTSGGLDETKNLSVSSFTETLNQSVKDLDIQGMSQIKGKKYKHPISGQPMYVSIYGISSRAVQQAKIMEESQAKVTQDMIRENQRSKGVKAGYEKAISKAKNDTSSYQKGMEKGNASSKTKPVDNSKSDSKKSTKGGFKGGGTTSGAFK